MAVHLTSIRSFNCKITLPGSLTSRNLSSLLIKKRNSNCNYYTNNKRNNNLLFKNRSVLNFKCNILSNFKQCRYYSVSQDYVIESPFGDVEIPNLTLPQMVWRDLEEWSDKPLIVSK